MWRPTWVRRTASFLLGAGAVLLLDLAYAGSTFTVTMRSSVRHLRAAQRSLDSSDALGAARHLAAATSAAELATARLQRPSARLVAQLDLFDADLETAAVISDTTGDVAAAAARLVGETFELGSAERGLFGSLYEEGTVDLAAVGALRSGLEELESHLGSATQRIATAPVPRFGAVADARAAAGRRLDRTRRDVARLGTVAELLPDLLGGAGPRRYLLALQSPSEARAGGGLVGVYGVLAADGGRLDLEHVGAIEELVARFDGSVAGPRWFEGLYGRFLGLEEIRHANLTPSFPASSDILLRMYRRATGDDLDGVIALDPLAVGELTRGTGPLEAPGWDRTIGRFTARRVLLHDIYRHFDRKERIQNEYLRGLIDVLWDRLAEGDVRVGPLARGLANATQEQHLKVFSTDPAVAPLLSELRIDGDYRAAGGDVHMVFHNNFAANKVDFFLKRTVSTRLVLEDGGAATVVTTVELDNDVPEDRSVLVRPLRRDLEYGINRMVLSFLLPEGAEARRITIDGRDSNFFPGFEYRYPVAWQILDVEPDATSTVRLTWRWPDAWQIDSDGPDLELALWPQALARPDFTSVTIEPPPGYTLRGPATFTFRHRPPRTLAIDLVGSAP